MLGIYHNLPTRPTEERCFQNFSTRGSATTRTGRSIDRASASSPRKMSTLFCAHTSFMPTLPSTTPCWSRASGTMIRPQRWKACTYKHYLFFLGTTCTELMNTSFIVHSSSLCCYPPLNLLSRYLIPHLYCRSLSSPTVVLVSTRLVLSTSPDSFSV